MIVLPKWTKPTATRDIPIHTLVIVKIPHGFLSHLEWHFGVLQA